ncbi:hypothetical protein FGO68_gene8422 [Halteria grandinella]|uniref:Uncharacterized protein n=1 Tax=Halteria grandinella TaxID=5974 RepID=A0A8J8ND19_HALGN|nr:hypothetical protein FGO68_gene8422 [Halteria grandinella]
MFAATHLVDNNLINKAKSSRGKATQYLQNIISSSKGIGVSTSIRDDDQAIHSEGEFDDKATMKMGSNAQLIDGQEDLSHTQSIIQAMQTMEQQQFKVKPQIRLRPQNI